MENLYETKLSVYEFVQGNFEPDYRLVANKDNLEKVESTKLENLVLNVFSPGRSVNEDTVKKDIIVPRVIEKNIAKDDLKEDINEIWEDYWTGNIYFSNLKEFFDDAAEESRAYDSIIKNLQYNANNSEVEVYQIPEAKEILEHAKTMQGIRGGKPKQKYLNAINDQLRGVYEKYDDLLNSL